MSVSTVIVKMAGNVLTRSMAIVANAFKAIAAQVVN